MKVWVLKAVVQKAISLLPFKHNINFLFQKYITKGVNLTDALFEDKLIHCSNHIKAWNNHSVKTPNYTALELGTGWYPIVPVGLYLAGAGKVITLDIAALMNEERMYNTLDKFKQYYESGKLQTYIPTINKERYNKLVELTTQRNKTLSEILSILNIEYRLEDARSLNLPTESVDLINSNNVFEHIYPDILTDILKEFKRILSKDGIMSHFIDMSDHFAHLDKAITPYNYLQFTEGQWATIDNSVQPQNRMRINQHRQIITNNGFNIVEEENRPGDLKQLESITLAPPFNGFSNSDNVITHTHMVMVKA
jgi:SAM-dependent methyltransferase